MRVERTNLARLTAITDGVMAVSITLLVLSIEVPRVPADQLSGELDELIVPLLAYALAFALVGRFWVIHHRLFEELRDVDGRADGAEPAVPRPRRSAPLLNRPDEPFDEEAEANAVFAVTIAAISATHWVMSRYSARHVSYVRRPMHRTAHPIGLAFALFFFRRSRWPTSPPGWRS